VERSQGRDADVIAEIAERYHLLAIAVLLEDADPDAFARLLALAAQSGSFLRSLDLAAPPRRLAASRSEAFCDALAAGDLVLARTLAGQAPRAWLQGWEYEDDFLRFHFLHRLALDDDEATLASLLARWERVLEGAPSCHLEVSRALLRRDAAALDAALLATAQERADRLAAWRKMATYDAEVDATEGAVFVAGLAVIRLAEQRGLALPEEYPFMPRIARVPSGLALPAPDSWRSFDKALALASS